MWMENKVLLKWNKEISYIFLQGTIVLNYKINKLKTIYWPKHHSYGHFLQMRIQYIYYVTHLEYE